MKLHALLRDIVGAANVLTDPQDTAPYFTDWRKQYSAAAECVVRPASTAEVARVVALCARESVALVPQGGNTGLSGDRKSTRLNSSHITISYAVFCLKKKKKHKR